MMSIFRKASYSVSVDFISSTIPSRDFSKDFCADSISSTQISIWSSFLYWWGFALLMYLPINRS
mgnify:CR=1 FL=1